MLLLDANNVVVIIIIDRSEAKFAGFSERLQREKRGTNGRERKRWGASLCKPPRTGEHTELTEQKKSRGPQNWTQLQLKYLTPTKANKNNPAAAAAAAAIH